MTNAAGMAQGMRDEAETAMRSWFEQRMREMNFVAREEFEVVQEMARRAREENEALKERISALEAKLSSDG